MKALLVLSDGTVYEGSSIGKPGCTIGEVVFNTGMTGYQEILTDPSYRGQIVALTYPLIGNYGVNEEDVESVDAQVAGLVVRELCDLPSNFRATTDTHHFLERHAIVGIEGVDVRALTKKIRAHGVMMGGISTEHTPSELVEAILSAPAYADKNYVQEVSTRDAYQWDRDDTHTARQWTMEFFSTCRVVVLDYGVKFNILRSLRARGCEVIVVPCDATLEDILRFQPNGILLSNGPGDPAMLTQQVCNVQSFLRYSEAHAMPIMGICLGHQLLGAALGGKTFKMKFGHRGANHPVKDLTTHRVYITSQNHGYAVAPDGLPQDVKVSQINLNDHTIEGLQHKYLPIFSVQYHPEANPGPKDNRYLFDRFIQAMEQKGCATR